MHGDAEMPPTDLDDTRGGNGHADPLADTLRLDEPPLPWPLPESRFQRVRRAMTGRARPSSHQEEAPLTRVPGWIVTVACGAFLLAVPQAGFLIYRISHYDTVEGQVRERMSDVYLDLRAQDQYNQLVTIYENKIQQLLIKAGVKVEELPPVPVRPVLGKPHPKREDEGDE